MRMIQFDNKSKDKCLKQIFRTDNLKTVNERDLSLDNKYILKIYLDGKQVGLSPNFLRDSLFGSQFYELDHTRKFIVFQSMDGETLKMSVFHKN